MKTWLITGCSTGLGRSLAKAVLKKGYKIKENGSHKRLQIKGQAFKPAK